MEIVTGTAWSRPASGGARGSPAALRAGDTVAPGVTLETGEEGRVAVRMASGHSLRLDAGTFLRVLSERRVALDRGAAYVDSGHLAGAEGMEVRTPLGAVREIGTQFEVRVQESSVRIRVRTGAVSLSGGEAVIEVGAGEEVEVDAAGRWNRRQVAAFGEQWAWVAEIAPVMDLEGRLLREFLDWVAHERGLRVRFSSPDLARAAEEITLSGSVRGMTLDQALDSVLATCGMSANTEEGVLAVVRAGARRPASP